MPIIDETDLLSTASSNTLVKALALSKGINSQTGYM